MDIAETVAHFHRSSYLIGRMLAHDNRTLNDLGALLERDYAAHGGAFPIFLRGTRLRRRHRRLRPA